MAHDDTGCNTAQAPRFFSILEKLSHQLICRPSKWESNWRNVYETGFSAALVPRPQFVPAGNRRIRIQTNTNRSLNTSLSTISFFISHSYSTPATWKDVNVRILTWAAVSAPGFITSGSSGGVLQHYYYKNTFLNYFLKYFLNYCFEVGFWLQHYYKNYFLLSYYIIGIPTMFKNYSQNTNLSMLTSV